MHTPIASCQFHTQYLVHPAHTPSLTSCTQHTHQASATRQVVGRRPIINKRNPFSLPISRSLSLFLSLSPSLSLFCKLCCICSMMARLEQLDPDLDIQQLVKSMRVSRNFLVPNLTPPIFLPFEAHFSFYEVVSVIR